MNRYEQQLSRAQQAINEMQDEHLIVKHQLRDALAENLRLLRIIEDKQDRRRALFCTECLRAVDEETFDALDGMCEKCDRMHWKPQVVLVDTYFDVLNWTWVGFADIEVRL